MSALCVKLTALLSLCCLGRTRPVGSSEVKYVDEGGAITIQCNCPDPNQNFLNVKRGLNKDVQVLFKPKEVNKITIAKEFTGRLQTNGDIPRLDIRITNLTSNDTGPYWCLYTKLDDLIITEGSGSILLVVKGVRLLSDHRSTTEPGVKQDCKPSGPNEVLMIASIAGGFCILLGVLLCVILKTKAVRRRQRHQDKSSALI